MLCHSVIGNLERDLRCVTSQTATFQTYHFVAPCCFCGLVSTNVSGRMGCILYLLCNYVNRYLFYGTTFHICYRIYSHVVYLRIYDFSYPSYRHSTSDLTMLEPSVLQTGGILYLSSTYSSVTYPTLLLYMPILTSMIWPIGVVTQLSHLAFF